MKIQLLSLLFLLAAPLALSAQLASFQSVTPEQAVDLVKSGALLVDVREADEVAELAYDVDDMVVLPLSELEDRINELPTERKLVMACRSGNRSGKAIALLQRAGYTNLVNLEGGIKGWQTAGLDVVTAEQQQAAAKPAGKKGCCADKAKSCGKGS